MVWTWRECEMRLIDDEERSGLESGWGRSWRRGVHDRRRREESILDAASGDGIEIAVGTDAWGKTADNSERVEIAERAKVKLPGRGSIESAKRMKLTER